MIMNSSQTTTLTNESTRVKETVETMSERIGAAISIVNSFENTNHKDAISSFLNLLLNDQNHSGSEEKNVPKLSSEFETFLKEVVDEIIEVSVGTAKGSGTTNNISGVTATESHAITIDDQDNSIESQIIGIIVSKSMEKMLEEAKDNFNSYGDKQSKTNESMYGITQQLIEPLKNHLSLKSKQRKNNVDEDFEKNVHFGLIF